MSLRYLHKAQSGFTLIEIIVSTAIFITVVSSTLALFNYTLQINRRVQALREVVQSSRTFTETLTREIRNGRIDYHSTFSECDATNYTFSNNQSLAILTKSGDKLCFYLDSASHNFMLKKQSSAGSTTNLVFESSRFKVIADTFRFYVMPKTDPNPPTTPYPEQQPFVTILAQFELIGVDTTPTIIDYQTTISTDVYDIYKD